MGTVNDLVDTTEMYLRTIYDLEEEGIVPLRARIAERLDQSGPTVSQTVARMERDGLLRVAGDRHLARVRHVQPAKQVKQRALALARRADDRDQLARVDGEVDAVDGGDVLLL